MQMSKTPQRKYSHYLLSKVSEKISGPILKEILLSKVLSKYFKGLTHAGAKKHDLEKLSQLSLDQLLEQIKLCDIEGPSEPWTVSRLPLPHQCTLGDDIKRINYVYQRSIDYQAEVTKDEFDELWIVLNNVAKRMDKLLKKTRDTFSNKLDEVRHTKLSYNRTRISAPCLQTVLETERLIQRIEKQRFSTHTGIVGTRTEKRQHKAYGIKLLYPPDSLNNYDYISNAFINILNKVESGKGLHTEAGIWKEDFTLIAHSIGGAQEFCLKYFNSECTATPMKWKTLTDEETVFKHGGSKFCSTDSKTSCRLIVVEVMEKTDTGEVEFLMSVLEKYVHSCESFFVVNENRKAQMELYNMNTKYPQLRMNILDGDDFNMTDALYRCLRVKLNTIRNMLSITGDRSEQDTVTRLETLESECHAQYRDICIPDELSRRLKKLRIFDVVAFTSKGDKVYAYVLERDKERCDKAIKKLQIIKHSYPFLEWKFISDEIKVKAYHQPGEYITMRKTQQAGNEHKESYCRGTLGIYAERRNKSLVALTGAHVIEENEDAYFQTTENRLLKLGSCIFSPRSDDVYVANVKDIGVIEINESISHYLKRDRLGLNVTVYKDDNIRMFRKRVFKYGGTTNRTEGFVVRTNYELQIGSQSVPILLIEEIKQNDEDRFAKPGDSGSMVICKRGPNKGDAVAVVFGGELNLPEIPKHWGVVVRLDKAINEYNEKMNDTLCIDRI